MKEFFASFKSSLPAWSAPLCGLTGAALFLAAPASDYIVGQNIVADGGYTLR